MNIIYILIRFLSSPLLLGVVLIYHLFMSIYKIALFVRFGGEFIPYDKHLNRKTIFKTYKRLEDIGKLLD